MTIRFGDCDFDEERRRLTRRGDRVHLSPKAFVLLGALLRQRPRPMTKQDVTALLWPDVVVEEANIRNLIAEIRDAIGDRAGNPRLIRTIPRFGYAFEGDAADAGAPAKRTGGVPRLISQYRDYVLDQAENFIGRDSDCTVFLDDPLVSRRHAVIRVDGGGMSIEDLASRNGTLVNGAKIEGVTEISRGDVIEVGAVRLTLRLTDPRMETAPMIPRTGS